MKTAIYIEDGMVQLVVTPETEFEKNSLSSLRDKPLDAQLFAGAFYDCRGGWVRQTAYQERLQYFDNTPRDESLILVARESEPQPTHDEIPDPMRGVRGENIMITEARALGEDTTGLCTVREFAEILTNDDVGNYLGEPNHHFPLGAPKGEMTFTHKGKRYTVEMRVVQCENVPSTTGLSP